MVVSTKRIVLVAVIAASVGALVAARSGRQRLAGVSEDDLRAYIDSKLSERLTEERLVRIQDTLVRVADLIAASAEVPSDEDAGDPPADEGNEERDHEPDTAGE